MRTAGFPCRLLGCDQVFRVADQKSMDELRAASAARTAHELSSHDYHHVTLANDPWPRPFGVRTARPKADADPAGRRS